MSLGGEGRHKTEAAGSRPSGSLIPSIHACGAGVMGAKANHLAPTQTRTVVFQLFDVLFSLSGETRHPCSLASLVRKSFKVHSACLSLGDVTTSTNPFR